MIYHVFANRMNIGDWMSARGIQQQLAPRPIRNLLPNLGGIDISPVIVILIIFFIQSVVIPNLARALIAA